MTLDIYCKYCSALHFASGDLNSSRIGAAKFNSLCSQCHVLLPYPLKVQNGHCDQEYFIVFQIFTYEVGMFLVLHTKLICSMDHGKYSDALFEVTRPIDDILWLNIQRCIYGALIPSRIK